MKIAGMKVELPSGWKVARCEDIIDVRDGTHDTPKYISSGYPLVTSKNLKSEGIDFSTVSYISEKDHFEISKRSKVDRGDILFAMIGTIGNPVIVNIDTAFSIKNVALFKFSESSIDARYFKYLLETPIITRQLDSEQRGGTQKFVSLKVLRNMLIPYPSPEEQRRIAAILDKADAVRRKRKEAIALTEELLRSAFLEMFGDPITNPKGWDVKTIGQICNVTKLAGFEYTEYIQYQDAGEIIALRALNVKNGRLKLDDVKFINKSTSDFLRRSKLFRGDVVMTYIGVNIGDVAVIEEDNKYHLAPNIAKISPSNFVDSIYLMRCLEFNKSQFAKYTTNTAKQALNMNKIRGLEIPLPPLSLQQIFSEHIGKIQKLKNRNQKSFNQTNTLFNSLLQRAFRGEL